ncbi:MmgE/PrpD family protein [Sporomusa acidovorans]|uniref:2-methylcitrate dehydratase n=1 Tax=Sporomusa acidovorans (strain ATCC 49682 / DSM 3132 / Mol) TaxID=1123286 RepID=A0ABZ3J6S2_SPOA4|nr:MmgE/PrpD family protein [Sporomusa acidovorans]OZC21024.1 2-methylcitrate dehydratase [Sporomusa acidovorans DSM 3132]SDF18039.1 2-methylcitrate dehydratase PrpD [Sporomusa acidovorans]
MHEQNISQICVDFATNLTLDSVPIDVKEQAQKCLLDWLGCAIRGSVMPQADCIKEYAAAMGGNQHASIIGSQTANSAFHAALCNGYFSHILEIDDVDKKSITHPGAVVIPAALSIGDWQGCTGAELLTAIIAGYEVMLRVGAAVTPAHYEIWHTTATAGVFGSAVAAGRMLKLDAKAMTWAFGNAGSMAAGLWEFLQDGAMSKYLHAGKAAAAGVLVSCMAKHGFTGATRILEGRQGFFAGYARQAVNMDVFADFGANYHTAGISFKPYPCCRHTHSAIDCAIKLNNKLKFSMESIKHIVIDTYHAAIQVAGNENPADSRQAQFSIKYCVVCALLAGKINLDSFAETAIFDQAVRRLMNITTVVVDETINNATPVAWPARISLELTDGQIMSEYVEYPKGDPENALTWPEIKDKFSFLVDGILDNSSISEVINMCEELETLKKCSDILRKVNLNAKF